MSKIVIALGGNALQSKNSEPTAQGQLGVVRKTCEYIADISCSGYELAIVHGNGPQVGRILLASETAKEVAGKYLGQDEKVLELSLQWIQFDDLAVTEAAYQSLADKVQEYGINDNPPAFVDFVYQAGENKKGE